ncbi:hypothetical protein pdam_00014559 [Pocillopora damicornis]|uniref:Uncharacterized protein n=1 Tax=Pocillopora damicornis TaxID=46731 RepID=A0A3M6TPA0_POCDA|nr:hypothetical protein pdam_00014559 [Pocillopora damicornis]
MQETVSILQAQIQTKRRVLELCKERQRVEEEKQEIMKNTRSYLLAQAEQIESRLKRALLKSQQSMSDMIYVSSITTIFFNSKTLDMERKAIVFWNNLNNSAKDLGKVADMWKPGKLRRVRALNDLSTSREEIFDDEFTTCEFPGDLSDDDDALTEILRNEKFEGSLSIMEPFF